MHTRTYARTRVQVENLSGGELQRFAIAVVAVQRADVYMFDEPSSYLDVKQRLKVRSEHGPRAPRADSGLLVSRRQPK